MHAELVARTGDLVGESPRWDSAGQRLLWVDAERQTVHCLGQDGVVRDSPMSRAITSLALTPDGVVGTGHDGLRELVEVSQGSFVDGALLTPYAENAIAPVNDSGADPAGRLLVGFGSETVPGHGVVVDVADPGAPLLSGMFFPNGLAWSPDGRRLYVADSYRLSVDAYEYDAARGRVGERTTLVTSHPGVLPDGLTVDAAGGVWVAFWGGGNVSRFAPDGELLERVELPARQVSSCAFGGTDLQDLYITTADYSREDSEGGHLYVVRGAGSGQPQLLCDPSTWDASREEIG
jgi:sugar lactone lactonase YvrE